MKLSELNVHSINKSPKSSITAPVSATVTAQVTAISPPVTLVYSISPGRSEVGAIVSPEDAKISTKKNPLQQKMLP